MSSMVELFKNLRPRIISLSLGYCRLNKMKIPFNVVQLCAIFYQPADYFIHNIYNANSYIISNYSQSMRRLFCSSSEFGTEINYIYGFNVININKMNTNIIHFEWTIIINDMDKNMDEGSLFLGIIDKSNNIINEKTKWHSYYAIDIDGRAKYYSNTSFDFVKEYKYNFSSNLQKRNVIKIIFKKKDKPINCFDIYFVKKKKIILEYKNIFLYSGNFRLFINSAQRHTLMTILKFNTKQKKNTIYLNVVQ